MGKASNGGQDHFSIALVANGQTVTEQVMMSLWQLVNDGQVGQSPNMEIEPTLCNLQCVGCVGEYCQCRHAHMPNKPRHIEALCLP